MQYFDKHTLENFIFDNKYQAETKMIEKSVCSDYACDSTEKPFIMPGGDLGQAVLMFSTCNSYGIEVKPEILWDSFRRIVSLKEEKLPIHSHCQFWHIIQENYGDFNLEKEQLDFIRNNTEVTVNDTTANRKLSGAVLQIKGYYGVHPQLAGGNSREDTISQVFLLHQTYLNERNKYAASLLKDSGHIRLLPGQEEEYLYEILSDTADILFFETAKHLCHNFPIFAVSFDKEGLVEIEDLGKII